MATNIKTSNEISSVFVIRNNVLNSALVTVAILSFPGLVASLARYFDLGWQNIYFVHIASYITVLLAAIYRHRLPLSARVSIMFGLLFVTGAVSVLVWGLLGNVSFLLILVAMATILFGTRAGMVSLGTIVVLFTLLLVALQQEIITYDEIEYYEYGTSLSTWISRITSIGFFGAMMVAAGGQLYRALIEKIQDLEQVNTDLTNEIRERRTAQHELEQYKRQLEQLVDARTLQLQEKVDELEAFSYSVSHDLRAPLRAIMGFSSILLNSDEQLAPEKSQHYLDRIHSNVNKLSELVDDLLALSRVGRKELKLQTIQPQEIVEAILDELRDNNQLHNATVSVGEMPSCQADPVLLAQVFSNLITNSIKYTQPDKSAVIRIGSQINNGETVYYIQDEGVGFDMAYYDKLFAVFQRLHGGADYEGTGIGLSIVKRIIERHEGRVWAESAVNQGATFYFTLKAGN